MNRLLIPSAHIFFPLVALLAATTEPLSAAEPLAVSTGIHLLLDDHFIAESKGVVRRLMTPERFLDAPIITGELKHQNWQPFLTVLHDAAQPAERRFRMWYNVDVLDDPRDGEFSGVTGYLESADGVRWPGPYTRLKSLTVDGRVRFGASVVDDGPEKPDRYKMMYFDAGKYAGPRVAFSRDGLDWRVQAAGKPVIATPNGDDIWTAGWDPLRKRYFLIGKKYGPYAWTNAEGKRVEANIRRYYTCFSQDFKTWSEPKWVYQPDEQDPGVTQWYGAAGFLARGDLIVGFLRVLRDDLSPAGAPEAAIAANTRGPAGLGASGLGERGGSGMGYTMLTWTRDGETWRRDRDPVRYFEPDPKPGAWDHAMAWIGSAAPVGDEVYLYYAGYRWGHKYHHSTERQLGLVKARRDRFVAREAGERGGTLITPPLVLDAKELALNVDAAQGEVRVQLADQAGKPLAGFRFQDCQPITSDSLAAPVEWKQSLESLRGRTVRLEILLTSAQLFAFETR